MMVFMLFKSMHYAYIFHYVIYFIYNYYILRSIAML